MSGSLDTLIYDSPNTAGLPGDGGFIPYPDAMCALDSGDGFALGRDDQHTDPAACSQDFSIVTPYFCPDADQDGYFDETCCGDDCDDTDPAVNPGVVDSQTAGNFEDDVDNDCDGLVDSDPECEEQPCFIGAMASTLGT